MGAEPERTGTGMGTLEESWERAGGVFGWVAPHLLELYTRMESSRSATANLLVWGCQAKARTVQPALRGQTGSGDTPGPPKAAPKKSPLKYTQIFPPAARWGRFLC